VGYRRRVEKRDIHAALEARRELGPAYDDEVVDALLRTIDQRLEQRPAAAPAKHGVGLGTAVLLLGMFGCGVGATAIALTHGAAWVAAVIWLALAGAAREILGR
jgi:hypothetical protein